MNLQYYHIVLFCFLLVISGIVAGSDLKEPLGNLSPQGNFTDQISVPDIQSVLKNPDQYLGKTVVLNGIVTKTYPTQNLFILADRFGCSFCTAKNSLDSINVWYPGKVPKLMETVQIFGQVVPESKKGVRINATTLKA